MFSKLADCDIIGLTFLEENLSSIVLVHTKGIQDTQDEEAVVTAILAKGKNFKNSFSEWVSSESISRSDIRKTYGR